MHALRDRRLQAVAVGAKFARQLAEQGPARLPESGLVAVRPAGEDRISRVAARCTLDRLREAAPERGYGQGYPILDVEQGQDERHPALVRGLANRRRRRRGGLHVRLAAPLVLDHDPHEYPRAYPAPPAETEPLDELVHRTRVELHGKAVVGADLEAVLLDESLRIGESLLHSRRFLRTPQPGQSHQHRAHRLRESRIGRAPVLRDDPGGVEIGVELVAFVGSVVRRGPPEPREAGHRQHRAREPPSAPRVDRSFPMPMPMPMFHRANLQ